MKIPDIKLINFESHLDKCRICFIGPLNKKTEITKVIQIKFQKLTGIELHIDPNCSSFLCTRCDTKLKETSNYVKSIADIQRKFYKHINLPLKGEPEKIVVKFEGGGGVEDVTNEEADDPSSSFLFDSRTFLKRFRPENEESDGGNEAEFDDVPMVDGSDGDESMDVPLKQLKREKKKSPKKEKKFTKLKLRTGRSDDKHSCDVCGKLFKSQFTLRHHKTKIHPTEANRCPVDSCWKVFDNRLLLRQHMKTHQKDSSILCNECGRACADENDLEKHIRSTHERDLKYFCDLCGYGADIKHYMTLHMRRHHMAKKLLSCLESDCSFTTFSKAALLHHNKKVHIGNIFECFCGKSFYLKSQLQTHKNEVHSNIRNFKCSQCDKGFFKNRSLQEHIKSAHLQKKDIACETCGRLFSTKRILHNHQLTHSEPKFKCEHPDCDRSFHTKGKLEKHQKLHLDIRDLMCHLCDKSYFYQKDLQRHLDVVHKQVIWFCELCEYTNSRKDYLGNHLKSAHSLEKEEIRSVLKRAKCERNQV